MASYARLGYNGKVQTIALFEGMNTEELTSLLKTKGLVIPISLVSRTPSVVPNTLCKLLVANATSSQSKAPNDKLLNTQTNKPVSLHNMPTDLSVEDSNLVSEQDSSEAVTLEIMEFIEGLRTRNFLTNSQASLLNSLLASNSTLLFAAYSVAISANDSEYLAEICKDLAQSLVTEQGRSACEAQDEVLQVSDQLYINNRISENQLLYLRHLVLIREEEVATVYDRFQEHQNVPLLAKELYELCNTHPYQHARQSQGQNQATNTDEGDEDEDEEEEDEEDEGENDRTTSAKAGLQGVVGLMMRARRLTQPEAQLLLELIRAENEYVMAAFELYESDGKIDELQDTLLRCAKLEVRKRKLDEQEGQLEALYQRSLQSKYDVAEDADEDGEEEEEEEEDEEDDNDAHFTLEDIGLDSILESLDVVNIWEATVPANFVKTVFIAVIRKQLDIYQAKALCDLYHANYDLVRAAWEVYTVQNDTVDLLDTLRRVVKDLTLDEDDDEEGLASSVDSDGRRGSAPVAPAPAAKAPAVNAPAAKAAASKASASAAPPIPTASKNTASPSSSAAQAAQDRKQEALAAVAAAKRDLLKHSLEMMVKQGIVTGEAAGNLYKRYLQGDMLAEAAIDAYAADRNVAEFLDTLQILANHSPEELSDMMKDVAEEATENATSASPTAANTRANSHITPEDAPLPPPAPVPTNIAAAQMQLKGIVAELARNQMISAEVHSVLNRLVSEPDRRLLVAFQRYLTTQEGAKLIDTLLQVAAAELAVQGRSPTNRQQTAARSQQEQDDESEEEDEEEDERSDNPNAENDSDAEDGNTGAAAGGNRESLLNASDQKTVIEILSRANALSATQASVLNALVDAGNRTVRNIFLGYEEDKDVYRLIDSLKALNLEGEDDDGEDEQDEEDDRVNDNDEADVADDADENEGGEFDEDDGASIDTRFLQIVQRMHLSHLETAALRLAIARDDAGVRNAIEAFRTNLNENALMAALREVSKQTIRNTLSDQEAQDFDGAVDGEEDEEGDQQDDQDDDDLEGYNYGNDQDGDPDTDSTESHNGEAESEDENEAAARAEAKEVDDLIARYSRFSHTAGSNAAGSTSAGASSATGRSEAKQGSPGGAGANRASQQQYSQREEARAKSYNSGHSGHSGHGSYDYKHQHEPAESKDASSEEEDEEEDDEDDEEDDEQNDQGTSLITSQAARNHVFPILVNELVKENILTSRQGSTIMKQFAEGNALVSAAIDVYDRDSDLAQLVQTLQSAVDHSR